MASNWTNSDPVDVRTVRGWLEAGRKVILYVRHGERPPIAPDDPTFGAALELTPRGRECALSIGSALRGAVRSFQLKASPMQRTRITARLIAEGAGLGAGLPVEDSVEISVRNVFLDPGAVHDEMDRVGVMDFMLSYLEKGEAPFCRPLHEAKDLAVGFLERDAKAQLNLYCGHDFMIAAALAGLELARYTAETWIPFLTGLAMASRPDGTWERRWFA